MERRVEAFRAAVRRALTGRTASRAALSHGLPKDAIRNVLHGHDPKLTRADDVCRALGITYVLGGPTEEGGAGAGDGSSGAPTPAEVELVRNVQLAELLSRLADQWDTIPVKERAGLALVIAGALDLSGADAGSSLLRTIESLGWRKRE